MFYKAVTFLCFILQHNYVSTALYYNMGTNDTDVSIGLNAQQSIHLTTDDLINHVIASTNVNRLPASIIPGKYVIELSADIEHLKFHGSVNIFGTSDKMFNKRLIIFNADQINVTHVHVVHVSTNKQVPLYSISTIRHLQWFLIRLNEDLKPDTEYRISAKFSGDIRDQNGLYVSSFSTDEAKRPIVMTEFQPTYARRVFPCWDEPQFKASFTIRIARQPDQIALSNMPLISTSDPDPSENNKVWDTFEESPDMSTYLVTVIIGNLEKYSHSENKNISIWTQSGKSNCTKYALNLTARILDKLEEFTEYEYILPKLDQVGVPALDFDAMENWGIITYVYTYLLTEQEGSLVEKQDVAYHMAHEISHQWFGNLVTFDWWNNVWLNEGFAQFFQYLLLDSLEPDWRTLDSLVVNDLQYILISDEQGNTQPISMKGVEDNLQIEKMFNSISYLKGGSIVRMLYHIMTPKLFQKGIARYIEDNALKSVTDEDLWDSLREVECLELDLPGDIADLMNNWVHKKGHPVIEMERIRNDSVGTHFIKLTQTRFMNDEQDIIDEEEDTRWWIPLSYTTSTELDFDDTEPKEWFNMSTEEHLLDLYLEEDEWIILNLQLSGFYRVNYDTFTWKLIIDDMIDNGFHDIHPLNRAALLHDSFYLALSGYLDLDIALNLTKYLARENDFVPWTTAENIFRELDRNLLGTPAKPLLQKYVKWLVSYWSTEIGFQENENDTDRIKLSRQTLVNIACDFGYKACLDEALNYVYLMISQADLRYSIDLENAYLCAAVSTGPDEVWQYVRKRYIEASNKKERESLIDSMACSRNSNILNEMLNDSIENNSFLVESDARYLVGAIISGTELSNLDLVLNFFSLNLEELITKHGKSQIISYFLRMALKSNKESTTKIYKLVYEHKETLQGISASITDRLKYSNNIELKKEYYNQLYEWLQREESNYENELFNKNDNIFFDLDSSQDDNDDDEEEEDNEEFDTTTPEEQTSEKSTTQFDDNDDITTDELVTQSTNYVTTVSYNKEMHDSTENEYAFEYEEDKEMSTPKLILKNTDKTSESSLSTNWKTNSPYFLIQLLLVNVVLIVLIR